MTKSITIATIFSLLASTSAFVPSRTAPLPSQVLSMSKYNKEGWMGQRSSDEKHEDMWEAQQELLKHRREHSGSKEDRMRKYSDQEDKHGELKTPWTKDNDKDDHNSKGRKD